MDLTPNTKKKWVKWTIALFITSALLFLAIQNIDAVRAFFAWLLNLTLPLIVGAAIAIIVNVPMKFFEKYLWKNAKSRLAQLLRRPMAFILSILIIFGCITGIVLIIIPELISSVKIIVEGSISLINKFDAMTAEEYAEIPFGNLLMQIDWDKALASIQDWIKNQSGVILKGAFTTLSSVIGVIFDLVVAFVFAIYLIFSKDAIKSQSAHMTRVWLPKGLSEWLIHAASITSSNLKSFISGQTLEALILGALCMLGMLIFKIPYAPMVSVLVGITALIPVVGAFIGGGIGTFMILTADPSKAWFFVIFLVILQQIEGNLIYPKVMGKKVNLPCMWILAAVTIGGGIAGAVGMLLSVPLTSTAYILIKEATEKREKKLFADQKPNEDTLDAESITEECDSSLPQNDDESIPSLSQNDEEASEKASQKDVKEAKPINKKTKKK